MSSRGPSAALAGDRNGYRFRRVLAQFCRQFDSALSARDPARAAALLEAHCDDLFVQGEARVFADCVRRIPAPETVLHPRTMLALAWRLAMQWRFEQAGHFLTAARQSIAEIERSGERAEASHLRLLLRHREVMLAQCQDDMPRTYTCARELIEEFPTANLYVKSSLFTALLHAAREQYKLGDLDRSDALARDCIEQAASWHVLAVHEAVAGATLFMAGRCDAAIVALRSGLNVVARLGGAGQSLGALTALPLAEIHYEQNALAQASELIADYVPVADGLGFVDQLVSGWLTAARLCRRRGDIDAALNVLERATLTAVAHGFERLHAWILADRARLLAESMRPAALERVIQDIGPCHDPTTVMARSNITSAHEARALAWVRLAHLRERTAEAIKVARSWCSFAACSGAVRSEIRWGVLLAKLLLLDGQRSAAIRALGRTAATAAPGRFFASFVDEGPLIESLLRERPDGFAAFGEAARAFVARLVPMFGRCNAGERIRTADEAASAKLGALGPKEIQVLTLAGQGWRNQDIGARLGMTEGTVKWYLHQIYEKLGVNKRAHAADQARRVGLIE